MAIGDYDKRYIAHIIVEADTPLNISSGETGILTDSLVMTDANGLPMILGTSLTGVIRHSIKKQNNEFDIDDVFGYQKYKKNKTKNRNNNDEDKDNGEGSRLIVSNAHFVGKDGKVIEGVQNNVNWNDEFYSKFLELPIRQHTAITDKGVAKDKSKYDEQVVYKGTRFKFSLELIGNKNDEKNWENILNILKDETFRIGGGTRKGFGKLKIISVRTKTFDLKKEFEDYANLTSSLNCDFAGEEIKDKLSSSNNWIKYVLKLEPEDFYLFGSGFGDSDVDMTPVFEEIISWDDDEPHFIEEKILIPTTSVKGAISHRVAFWYNKLNGVFADKLSLKDIENKSFVENNNEAVKTLFGYTLKNEKNGKQETKRGNVIFSDLFLENKKEEKVFNHVAIDRFTGGAIDGALFDEKVIAQKDEINFEILVNNEVLRDENIKKAFEKTLFDICSGILPLGGGVNRGHGVFKGKVYKNGKELNND